MTALRRIAPLFAPLVSSSAVGKRSPIPRRPRLACNRYGSTFQTTFLEKSLPRRVAENEAEARQNRPRGRLGSTYFSGAGIVSILALLVRRIGRAEVRSCRERSAPRVNH